MSRLNLMRCSRPSKVLIYAVKVNVGINLSNIVLRRHSRSATTEVGRGSCEKRPQWQLPLLPDPVLLTSSHHELHPPSHSLPSSGSCILFLLIVVFLHVIYHLALLPHLSMLLRRGKEGLHVGHQRHS